MPRRGKIVDRRRARHIKSAVPDKDWLGEWQGEASSRR